jgi:ferredoxin
MMEVSDLPEDIVVDRLRCVGHAVCVLLAPDHFAIDAEGKAVVIAPVDEASRADVEAAVSGCPSGALSWRDAGR